MASPLEPWPVEAVLLKGTPSVEGWRVQGGVTVYVLDGKLPLELCHLSSPEWPFELTRLWRRQPGDQFWIQHWVTFERTLRELAQFARDRGGLEDADGTAKSSWWLEEAARERERARGELLESSEFQDREIVERFQIGTDGVLERLVKIDEWEVARWVPVVPAGWAAGEMTWREFCFRQAHVGLMGGHRNCRDTQRILKRICWWQDMMKDIETMTNACLTCAKGRKRPTKQETVSVKPTSLECWEEVMMDFEGPMLPADSAGNCYVLSYVDTVSHNVLFEPCTDLTRQEVRRGFSKLMFRSRTVPRLLRTDRGQEFRSAVFQEYCAVVGIQQKFAAPLRPVEMGACERLHQESQKLLGVLLHDLHDVCGVYPHEWSELLPVVEFLLATTPTQAGIAPRDLERAWSMAIPLERDLEPFTVLEWEPISEYAARLFRRYRELRAKVLDHRAEESAKRASLVNRFRVSKQLCAGDVVVLRDPRTARAGGRTPWRKQLSGSKPESRPMKFREQEDHHRPRSLGQMIEEKDDLTKVPKRAAGKPGDGMLSELKVFQHVAYKVAPDLKGKGAKQCCVGRVLTIQVAEREVTVHKYAALLSDDLRVKWKPLFVNAEGLEEARDLTDPKGVVTEFEIPGKALTTAEIEKLSKEAVTKWDRLSKAKSWDEVKAPLDVYRFSGVQLAEDPRRTPEYRAKVLERLRPRPLEAVRGQAGAHQKVRKRRIVVDYRRVNSRTVRAQYFSRKSWEVIAESAGSLYLSMLDAVTGFNQLQNSDRARRVLAVITRSGQFLPTCLTFGPVNGPEAFAYVMDRVYSRGSNRRSVERRRSDELLLCKPSSLKELERQMVMGRWVSGEATVRPSMTEGGLAVQEQQNALLKALRSSFPRLKNFLKDVEVFPEGTVALRPRHRVGLESSAKAMMVSGVMVILVVVIFSMKAMMASGVMVILVVVVSFSVKAMMVIGVMVIFGKCLVSQWRQRVDNGPEMPSPAGYHWEAVYGYNSGERLLETLAEGMQQLQKVQLDQFERAEKRKTEEPPEQCKPGTTSLPPLPPPSGNESAVALQDWIEVIDGPLRDISDSSSWWWDAVKERAQKGYQLWVASGPYERLSLKPPTADDLEQGRFSRLSARTAGMMLQAMTEGVRAEMVARAITRSPMALLFRLYTMYQPGGESEKAYILQYLVNPPRASSATDLVSVLRQWERLLLRADNLHIAKPDPSLLVRGLNGLVSDLWAKDKYVMFRTQLVKSRLGVDVSPTWESALQLHQHLRAESENLVNGLPSTVRPSTTTTESQRETRLKPFQPSPSTPVKPPTTTSATTSTPSGTTGGGTEKKCKWFTEPGGCRRGASCKFVHSFEGVSKKNRPGEEWCSSEIADRGTGATANSTNVADEFGIYNNGFLSVFLGRVEIDGTELKKYQRTPLDDRVSGDVSSVPRGVFKVTHPVWGELKTSLRGGCPELAQEQAAKLVDQIEDKKLREFQDGVSMLKSKLDYLVREEKLPWTTYAMRFLEEGLAKDLWKAVRGSFMKDLPEAVLDSLCTGVRVNQGWEHLKSLPLPRRVRKRMMDSDRWILHLPKHREEPPLKPEDYGENTVIVTVPPHLLSQAYDALLWGAATGRIAAVVGETPGCSMAKDTQTIRMARTMVLYVIGRLARPRGRTGFFWLMRKDDCEEEVAKLMVQFQQAASMCELNVNADGSPTSSRMRWVATTNYDFEDLRGELQSEEGKGDSVNKGWPMEWRRRLARAISDGNFRGSQKRDDGPFRTAGEDPGARGDRSKAAKMKYLLVAKFTLPKSYVTGEFEPTAQDPREEDLGMKDLFDEDGHVVGSKGVSDEVGRNDWLSDEEDYVPSMEEEDGEEEEKDTGAGVGPIPMDVKAPESTYLLFAEPLLNDKGPTVASAIQSIVLYLQSLNIPVLRFHSDRAAQLMARSLVQWLHGQAIRTTTSTPGVPQENGSAECAVKEVKLTTRKILSSSTLEKSFWPVAAKAAASLQRARVLRQVPRMVVAFGAKVLVKKRRDKAKLVDAGAGGRDDQGKGQGDELEPRAKKRIVGKSAPRVAVMERSSEFGIYEDDLPSDQEELHEDDDLVDETQEVMSGDCPVPRVAVLGSNRDEAQDGQGDSMDPEDYAREIIYNEDDVDERVIERLFELLPNQRLPRQTEDCGVSGLPPKAWKSGVYRHGGVLGVRKSSREFPYSTRLVNQFIREVLGDSTTWSTFSFHRNRLWTQAEAGEIGEDNEAVIVDGKRGRVRPLQSEEGTKEVVSFNPRQWHATMPWTGDRLVVAVYKVRGLNQIKTEDEDLALDLGFPLPTNGSESPRMCKLIGQEGEQPGPEPQEEAEVELEPVEEFMYIRMSEDEWHTTIAQHGPDRYVVEMAMRWRRIEPEEGNLNSVIPAAIAADVDRDWMAAPRIFLMSEDGEELHVGRMLGTRTTRIPDHDPEGLNSSFLKACKIYNLVTNEEEMI
ncbi:pol, partial [Symbiodinium sp. CCMP2456]